MKPIGYFLFFFITTFSTGVIAGNYQNEIDSLKLELVTADETEKPGILTVLSYTFKKNNEFNKSIRYGKQAIAIAEKQHQDSILYEALMTTSESMLRTGKYNDANLNYFKALAIARKLNKYKNVARCYNQLALNYLDLSDYEKSIVYFIKALSVLEDSLPELPEKSRMKYIALVTNNMGIVYNRMNNTDKALEFFTKSLKIRQQLNNQPGIASCLQNIAVVYGKKNNIDKELEYYYKALDIRKKLKNERNVAEVMMNIGMVQIKMKQYDKALKNLMQAKNVFEKVEDKAHIRYTLLSIANIYINKGEYDKAKQYLERNMKLNEELGSLDEMVMTYLAYEEYYAALGDYKNAWLTAKKILALKDTLNMVEVENKINELQTRYESEKKEKTIGRLKKETEIKELKLKQKNLQLYIILSLLVLLGVLSYFIIARYKLKQQKVKSDLEKKNLEVEQRLLRSQMNPHFIFNSLNSIQSFISSNNTFEAMTYLAKFAQLMRNILENSTKAAIPLSEEIDTLKLYIDLEKSRHKGKFDYRIHIDPEIHTAETLVPPMLIQPFVENSIKHGFRHIAGGGLLEIDFKKEEKWITCTVTDNGLGRGAGAGNVPSSEKNHRSRGMQLTEERLKTLSKQQGISVSFQIIDMYDDKGNAAGTKVIIKLPYNETDSWETEEKQSNISAINKH